MVSTFEFGPSGHRRGFLTRLWSNLNNGDRIHRQLKGTNDYDNDNIIHLDTATIYDYSQSPFDVSTGQVGLLESIESSDS